MVDIEWENLRGDKISMVHAIECENYCVAHGDF